MQSSMDHMPQMAGMQRNFLREFQSADAPMYGMQEAEPFQPTTAVSGADTAGHGICPLSAVGGAL